MKFGSEIKTRWETLVEHFGDFFFFFFAEKGRCIKGEENTEAEEGDVPVQDTAIAQDKEKRVSDFGAGPTHGFKYVSFKLKTL